MCGILVMNGSVDQPVLEAAIASAGRRGPHSHGQAWVDENDEWQAVFHDGPLLELNPNRELILAHSRLATDTSEAGGLPDADEGQPLVYQDWCLVHNGNAHELVGFDEGAHPRDSWRIMSVLAEYGPGAVEETLLEQNSPQALVVANTDGELWSIRVPGRFHEAHPLYLLEQRDGAIVSSGRTTDSELIPEGLIKL